jgi:hypothetical protein
MFDPGVREPICRGFPTMRDAYNRDRFSHATIPPAVLFLPLLIAGCGGGAPPVPEGMHLQFVRGKVTLANGTPLSQGKLVLTPKEAGQPLSGWLDSDGTFTLMEGQGLTISHGEFTVHIEPPSLPPDLTKTSKAQAIFARLQKARQQIPAKYQKPETSKLKATIGPDTKQIPTIVLK